MVAVERPLTLTSKAFRHVRVLFSGDDVARAATAHLEDVEGIEHILRDGAHLTFDAHGDMNTVVRLIAAHDISSIDIERPSLEEVFLKYYDGHVATHEA